MEKDLKQLLLVDLSARVPYGVKCKVFDFETPYTLSGISPDSYEELYFTQLDFKESDGYAGVNFCKPYLFPMSSMTDEQEAELIKFMAKDWHGMRYHTPDSIDLLNKNHFDYRCLIQKGLAIDCTNLNIY